jgi:hypothetical protein
MDAIAGLLPIKPRRRAMRSFGFRLTFLVATLWTAGGSTAWALGHRWDAVETVYVMPSSVALPVPTSYVVSTSWAEPTAYVVPTYYTTAYWMDPVVLAQPAYAETAYVRRRGLFGRRWEVERPVVATYATSYVPTTYYTTSYVPTVYSAAPAYRATSYTVAGPVYVPSAYIAAADCVCPPALASAAPIYPPPSSGTAAGTGTGSRPRVRESVPSDVEPPPDDLSPAGRGSAGAGGTAPGRSSGYSEGVRDTSPAAPPAQRPQTPAVRPETTVPQGVTPPAPGNVPGGQGGTTQPPAGTGQVGSPGVGTPGRLNPRASGANQGGGTTGSATPGLGSSGATQGGNETGTGPAAPPQAPGDVDSGPPPVTPAGDYRRESMRPSNYGTVPVRPAVRSVLVGVVRSDTDGELEEGVRIGLRNLATGTAKSTTTDAFGKFAVRVPDGDWAVEVPTRSGRVYEVSQIRVVNGQITDTTGRRVPSLEITR